jgi:ElaB/YqjD/DUF883 family membrane-anchored ribosome-binding protein
MATQNPTGTGMGGTGSTTGMTGSTTGMTGSRTEEYARQEGRQMGAELGERAGEKVGGVTAALGQRLDRAGDYIEDRRGSGFVSEKLHGAGRYLQENDPRSMARSLDSAICAHPYRGILIGLGVGWVVGRFLSSGRE